MTNASDLIVIPRITRVAIEALCDYVLAHGNVTLASHQVAEHLLKLTGCRVPDHSRREALKAASTAATQLARLANDGYLDRVLARAALAPNPAAVEKVIAECERTSGPDSHEDDYVQNFAEQILDMLRPATVTPAPDVLPEVERAPGSTDSRPGTIEVVDTKTIYDYATKAAGTYDAEIADVRVGTTRNGDERWSIMWVTNDADGWRRLLAWDSLVFSVRGRMRARAVFGALGHPKEGRVQIEPKDLLGAKARVTVTVAEYEAPNGATSATIRRNEVTYDGVQPMPRATRKGAR